MKHITAAERRLQMAGLVLGWFALGFVCSCLTPAPRALIDCINCLEGIPKLISEALWRPSPEQEVLLAVRAGFGLCHELAEGFHRVL